MLKNKRNTSKQKKTIAKHTLKRCLVSHDRSLYDPAAV